MTEIAIITQTAMLCQVGIMADFLSIGMQPGELRDLMNEIAKKGKRVRTIMKIQFGFDDNKLIEEIAISMGLYAMALTTQRIENYGFVQELVRAITDNEVDIEALRSYFVSKEFEMYFNSLEDWYNE